MRQKLATFDACSGSHDMVVCGQISGFCWFWLAERVFDEMVHTTMILVSMFLPDLQPLWCFDAISAVSSFAWYGWRLRFSYVWRFWAFGISFVKICCWMKHSAFGSSSLDDFALMLAPGCVKTTTGAESDGFVLSRCVTLRTCWLGRCLFGLWRFGCLREFVTSCERRVNSPIGSY